MKLKDLQAQLQEHARTAYALLPEEVSFSFGFITRKHIQQKAALGEWRQVVMVLESFSKENDFPLCLLNELALARQVMNHHNFIVAEEMLKRTSEADKHVIGHCLHALAYGPFITHDDELHSVTGLKRAELVQVAEAWPNIKREQLDRTPTYEFPDFISFSVNAVGNTMNNILGYPHHKEQEWSKHIQTPREEVAEVHQRWRELKKQIINS